MITVAERADLAGKVPEELEDLLGAHFASRGQPSYRAQQVRSWILERLVTSFEEMTDLPKAEREALAGAFSISALEASPAPRTAPRNTSGASRTAN
jgi:23S rRNA (adenine2503-C2)-methyltransferase